MLTVRADLAGRVTRQDVEDEQLALTTVPPVTLVEVSLVA
jgi:hypothetical protein